MSVELTQENFARHLHTKFRVRVNAPRPVELELVEVRGWMSLAWEQTSMEQFSIFFAGPPDLLLPQHLYTLEHEQMGTLDIFIVPVGRDASGVRYEAVFNLAR
ncbi:MAG TPA: hypothetical protein VF525_08975 [Pyrinomonadaceae bacterium]|jgi:predicted phage tail protein